MNDFQTFHEVSVFLFSRCWINIAVLSAVLTSLCVRVDPAYLNDIEKAEDSDINVVDF